jgi:glycerol uptake facilitator-like aquaporin
MNKYIVEFVGTLLLMLTILFTGNWLIIGGVLALCILIGGPISKGVFNPAVGASLVLAGKLPVNEFLPYTLVETLGALFAVLIYKQVVSSRK